MSRRRNRNTNKANKSNLVGLIATIIKEGDKNKGKRVLIEEVNNDIAKVFLLDDKEMNKFYLPVSDLRIFSRERSIKCLLENVIDGLRMDVANIAINSDEIWRKHANNHRHSDTSSLAKELDSIAECFGEFAKWCESNFSGKDNDDPILEEPKDNSEDDSEENFKKHRVYGNDLLFKCGRFCRDYNVSPMHFISKLSNYLYCVFEKYERYTPKTEIK